MITFPSYHISNMRGKININNMPKTNNPIKKKRRIKLNDINSLSTGMRRRLTISPEKSAPPPLPRTRKVTHAGMVGIPPSPSCSTKPKHVSRKVSKTGMNHPRKFTCAEMAKSPPLHSEELRQRNGQNVLVLQTGQNALACV